MSADNRLNAIRTRVYESEASLAGERARRSLLEREVIELEVLWKRDSDRLAGVAVGPLGVLDAGGEVPGNPDPPGSEEVHAELKRLRDQRAASRYQAAQAMALLAWYRAGYHRLADSRAIRIWDRLRAWRGDKNPSTGSAGRSADAALIGASGRFDTAWYLATYPDVADAQLDPIEHYLDAGAEEGRNPSADFDTCDYRAAHPGLPTGVNPLLHAIVHEAEQSF